MLTGLSRMLRSPGRLMLVGVSVALAGLVAGRSPEFASPDSYESAISGPAEDAFGLRDAYAGELTAEPADATPQSEEQGSTTLPMPEPAPLPAASPAVAIRPNVYANTQSMNAAVAGIPPRVYVPNSDAGTLTVIDPATFKVIDRYAVGRIPHHVAPAWDLSKLYVDNEGSSTLSVIDPSSGKVTGTIPVSYPYNLYFTPDGQKAVVVVERLRQLEFRNPQTWSLMKTVGIPWPGVDHLDFSADGSYLLASAEYSGVVAKVDTVKMELVGSLRVGKLPVDVRLAPDGSVFYVADQGRDGVAVMDGDALKEAGFIPTGAGAHGLQVSRDTKSLYVSNRLAGTISVIDFDSRRVVDTWRVGGSPDMLQLSPDGRQLWMSGRFDGEVYVADTMNGRVLSRIRTGAGAHGLSFFPAPGRYSTGHNGVYR